MIYITPDKWLSRPFGGCLRKNINTQILSIMFAGRDVFESAIVDSIITNIQKIFTDGIIVNRFIDNRVNYLHKINVNNLLAPYTLDFLSSKQILLINKIEQQKKKLRDYFECQSACATSDAYKLKPLMKSLSCIDDFNNKYYKAINTGTIGKYCSKWATNKIKYLKDDYFYPSILKDEFHKEFTNAYSNKVNTPKVII